MNDPSTLLEIPTLYLFNKRIYRFVLKRYIHSLGSSLSADQRNQLLDRRRRLEVRILSYEQKVSALMHIDDHTQWLDQDVNTAPIDPELSDNSSDFNLDGSFTPERDQIMLPSSLAPGEIERLSIQPIAIVECELRKGQVTDALEGLRLALVEKSMCFRNEVRNADSQRTTQRSWANVHKIDSEAQKHRYHYEQSREALNRICSDADYLGTLHHITDDDMKLAGDLTDERRFGQRSDTLAWFWQMGYGLDQSGPRMKECKFQHVVHDFVELNSWQFTG